MDITVGIPTDGEPVLEKAGDFTVLKNMLIGLDFHWQQTLEAVLPGKVVLNDDPVFRVLNRLPIERYLECVVGSEMNPSAPAEFLKAHAVISRSWALGKIRGDHDDSSVGKLSTDNYLISWEDTADHSGFDVCSDDHCQRYQGVQPVPEEVMKALRSTGGLVLESADGKPVDTRFSKCCGGRTELFSTCWQDREEVCLESFEDPWCDLTTLSRSGREKVLRAVLKEYDLFNGGGFRWEEVVTENDIRNNLRNKFGRDVGEIENIEAVERGPSGRIKMMRISGKNGELILGKELMIRRLLSQTHLYSSAFDIVTMPDHHVDEVQEATTRSWKLVGRGWGHGVGLCQIGAANMALNGYDFRSILAFYYPGSRIVRIPDFPLDSGIKNV